MGPSRKPRRTVVLVGAGFAGLAAARALSGSDMDVLVLDRHNFHTFTPLLYQIAAAGLEQDSIVKPVRAMFQRSPNVRFRLAEVEGVDLDRRRLVTDRGEISYDYLIFSAGSAVNYFGEAQALATTLPLKDVPDAVAIRSAVLSCFEEAALEHEAAVRRRLTTVVVVGGGPTGVELAGALAELKRHVLPRDYPELDLDGEAAIILLEATDTLLPGFPAALRDAAAHQLGDLGVDVRFRSPVQAADAEGVRLQDGTLIPAATVIWVAGVRASPLAMCLGVPLERNGRARVLPTLAIEGRPAVFVAGDMAHVEQEGRALPMMAPVAVQQGRHAALNILRLEAGEAPAPFAYKDRGMMATIGRRRAVAQVGPLRLTGFPAWITWLAVHLFWLIGFRNKVLVLVDWAWNYLFYEQGARIIAHGRDKARISNS